MKEFLIEQYNINHNDIIPTDLTMDQLKVILKDEPPRIGYYKSFVCERYRKLYCSKPNYVDYPLFQYNGVSYNCLRLNQYKIPPNDDCLLYLNSLIPTDDIEGGSGIAKQIYIYNPIDNTDNINGLYVTNYNNKLNIYYNINTNYILYQSQKDNKWILFDNDFNILYITDSTINSIPPSGVGGWHKVYNTTSSDLGINREELIPITVTYFNNTYYLDNIVRDLDETFITYDVSDRNTASMVHTYNNDIYNNIKAYYKYELMRMQLEISPVFTNIKLLISINTSSSSNIYNDIECSAVFSATTACKTILNQETSELNPIDCLKVSSNDPNAQETTFWVGNCNNTDNNLYTISAINEATAFFGSSTPQWTFDASTSCNCENPSNWIPDAYNKSFNYFILPLHKSNIDQFGGYVDGTNNVCNNVELQQEQTIELTCDNIDTCHTLAACFEDALEIMKNTGCGGTLGISDPSDITDWLNSVGDNLYNSTEELMSFIGNGINDAFATCLISYYDDIQSNCCTEAVDYVLINGLKKNARQLTLASPLHIYGPCHMLASHWNDGVTTQNPCNLLDICTQEECSSNPLVYTEGCFNDFSVDCYDDINHYCSGDNNKTNSNATELLNCLNDVTDPQFYLFPCCYSMINNPNFTTTITSNCISPGKGYYLCTPQSEYDILTNVYSMDCQIDANNHCSDIFDINTCKQELKSIDTSLISINCQSTLNLCEYEVDEYGEWFVTNKNTYSTSECGSGYIGTRRRYCNSSSDDEYGFAAWNDYIDTTGCIQLYCNEGNDNIGNKYWNISYPNTIQRYYGLDIPQEWINLYNNTCDVDVNTFELTRKCNLINKTYVEWQDPMLFCRSEYWYGWSKGMIHFDKRCDLDKSSLIYGLTVSDISECQTYCSDILSSDCIAFEYASQYHPLFNDTASSGPFCLFYADCKIISNLYSVAIDVYISPYSKSKSIENYCDNNGWKSWDLNGIPSEQCFNASLWSYFTEDGIINQDKIIFNDQSLLYDSINGYKSLSIVSTYNSFIINNIDDDDIAVDFLLNLRKYINDKLIGDNELFCIPGGLLIDLFSQYIGVREELFKNLLYVCICVAISGIVFLLNWWSVFVVILCNAAMIIEVYGFSHWFGLRVNAIFVLNIIIAIGLTMEFTAHVGRAFVLTTVNKSDIEERNGKDSHAQIRMKKTLREMFTPVSLGAFTTLLGVIPISFARFPYFRQYYFLLYIIIVGFGWLNGVIFQPIILSWLPPTPFVTNQDKHERNISNHESMMGMEIELEQQQQQQQQVQIQSPTHDNDEHEDQHEDEPQFN